MKEEKEEEEGGWKRRRKHGEQATESSLSYFRELNLFIHHFIYFHKKLIGLLYADSKLSVLRKDFHDLRTKQSLHVRMRLTRVVMK